METSNDKNDINDKISSEDNHEKIEKLLAQITELENEKQQSREEFSAQRGLLKKLFLQKEEELEKLKEEVIRLQTELDEARTQITVTNLDLEGKESERLKSQDELASLQQFVNATLDESGRYELEIQLLKSENDHLQTELQTLKASQHPHSHSHPPPPPPIGSDSVLVHPGQMLSSFARKVAQLGTIDSQQQHSQAFVENLEESMRKAKEESAVLKSLLEPLEEEIKSLKDKLRETDEQLQRYRAREEKVMTERAALLRKESANADNNNEDSSQDQDSRLNDEVCGMCLNYEEQLVLAQNKVTETERQLAAMERYKEQLSKETIFRKQMEEKWAESKEEHKTQVTDLQKKLEENEKIVAELKQNYLRLKEEIQRRFSELSEERKKTQEKLEIIEKENQTLVGKFIKSSQELQNENIDLPDSVEALQEMCLAQKEDLIKARLGMEQKEGIIQNLECISSASEIKREKLEQHMNTLNLELVKMEEALKDKTNKCSEFDRLKVQHESLQNEKRKLEESDREMHNRLLSLQTGLENGEAVQKDFVLLSQSLQKELQRLRDQSKELRWEHEDDVMECRGCRQSFKTSSMKKFNCKHCGRIFCATCLKYKVTSGPNRREFRICPFCHTLLNRETAPYFSNEPPHQPQ